MALVYTASDEDRVELERLRDQLKAERTQRGWSYRRACQEIGRSRNLLYEMENLKSALKMSSIQLWASIYGLRVEFQLADFWNFTWPHDEIMLLYQLSRQFDAWDYQRLWLVSALQVWRERMGITSSEVGYWMGVSAGAVTEWERSTNDPLLLRVMTQARLTKTSVTMKLWKREDWIFK